MRAAILVEHNAPLPVVELDVPALAVGQVLVQIECAGICGKQLEEIDGKRGPDPFLPHLLGHEGAGIVVEVSGGVRKVKAGDHVVLHWMKGTGIESAPPRFAWNGSTVSAGWVTTFSDYTIASENRLTPIPHDIPFAAAGLLGCAVTTGLGIVFNDAQLKPGQSIAVFGAGGVGVNVLQGAVLVNAHPVVAIDLSADTLQRAAALGATHTIDGAAPDLRAQLVDICNGRGFDVTVDLTGHASVRELAYALTSDTGTVVFAGVPHHDERITIDSFPLHFGRCLRGSHGGGTRPDSDIPRYIELYRRGKLRLDEQITHRYPLADINDAIERVRAGGAGRVVVSANGAAQWPEQPPGCTALHEGCDR